MMKLERYSHNIDADYYRWQVTGPKHIRFFRWWFSAFCFWLVCR